jgi:hypothetical protein
LTIIDAGLWLVVERDLVTAIEGSFGIVSWSVTADFSEAKSSSDVDNWRELSLLPPSNGKIAPVESEGSWFALDGCPLLLGKVAGGMVPRVLVFRRRDSNRATAAIRRRIATPPITPPAIVRLRTDELSAARTVEVLVGDVAGDRGEEWLEVVVETEEDGEIDDCGGATTQEKSRPLVTLKVLDGMTPSGA